MKPKQTFLHQFSIFQLILMALMAAFGIAAKPVITPLVHLITGPLFIPGGSIAGGFYMMWLVLGAGLVKKTGAGTLIGLVQALMVIAIGFMGSHGILSIVSYTLPGVAVDFVFLFSRRKQYQLLHYVMGGLAANVTGTMMTNLMFFRLPGVTVLFVLFSAALSGALGGILAYGLIKAMKRIPVLDSFWD
jgi:energy-coupling factor transport system substrate-specific component